MQQVKIIFLLIGQKGSGKSFIGTIFDKEFGIKFVRVEDWAIKIRKDREVVNEEYIKQVFEYIEKGIRDSLTKVDKLVFESTGLSEYFDQMLESLSRDFRVATISIYADSNLCLERVKSRDQSIHVNVSDEQVSIINRKVLERNLETNFYIINEYKTKKELMEEISTIVWTMLKKDKRCFV